MRALRTACFLAVPFVIVAACGGNVTTKGQLMVSLQTDMSLPKDIDKIGFQVYSGGSIAFGNEYDVGAAGLRLPATMGIVEGNTPGAQVRIRVTARKSNKLVVLNEVITTVPSGRLALLRVPIQWLCSGQATDGQGAGDPEAANGSATSTCGPQKMCVAGACVDENIDSSKLPNFDATLVFGGAAAPGDNGACLDTVGCFSNGFLENVDAIDCTIPKPSGGTGLNVALESGPTGAGVCSAEACLVPLDQSVTFGWTDLGNGRLQLPPGVCTALTKGTFLGVAVTTSCATKTESVPTCGSWNSSSSNLGTPDAGAPDASLLDASDASPPVDAGPTTDASAHDGGPGACGVFTVDQAACTAFTQMGCPMGNLQCNVVPSTAATACAPDGTVSSGGFCALDGGAATACGPGLYCLNGRCAPYCCSSKDCTAFAGDGGIPQCSQQPAANQTFFGVCVTL